MIITKKIKTMLNDYEFSTKLANTLNRENLVWQSNYVWCEKTLPTIKAIIEDKKNELKNYDYTKFDRHNEMKELMYRIESEKRNLNATKIEWESHSAPEHHTYMVGMVAVTGTTYHTEYETEVVPDEDARNAAKANLEKLYNEKANYPEYDEFERVYNTESNLKVDINVLNIYYDKCLDRKETSKNALKENKQTIINEIAKLTDTYDFLNNKFELKKLDKLQLPRLNVLNKIELEDNYEPYSKEKVYEDFESYSYKEKKDLRNCLSSDEEREKIYADTEHYHTRPDIQSTLMKNPKGLYNSNNETWDDGGNGCELR